MRMHGRLQPFFRKYGEGVNSDSILLPKGLLPVRMIHGLSEIISKEEKAVFCVVFHVKLACFHISFACVEEEISLAPMRGRATKTHFA